MDRKFISTSDGETANYLKKLGYQLVSLNNGKYTFLNNNKLTFSGDKSKIIYTDVLHI